VTHVRPVESSNLSPAGDPSVNDHTKANDQLKVVASQKGVTLPSQPDTKNQAEEARLEKMSGAHFDKAYMNYMVADH
jgi:putative membrane protein